MRCSTKVTLILAIVASCIIAVCLPSSVANAAYTSGNTRMFTGRGQSNRSMNDQEVSLGRWYGCDYSSSRDPSYHRNNITQGSLGALWLSTDFKSDNTTDNYYHNEVRVPVGVDVVDVQLRGSITNCQNRAIGGVVYAVNVESRSSRLSSLTSKTLSRGSIDSGASRHTWSTRGSYIGAKLDVSGTSNSLDITVRRCFSRDLTKIPPDDSCASETITVNIIRTDLTPTSYVTKEVNTWGAAGRDIKVEPGDTVYFRHKVENKKNFTTKYKGLIERHAGLNGSGAWSHNSDWSAVRTLGDKATWTSDTEIFVIPEDAVEGMYYCRRYYAGREADPTTNTSKVSMRACAEVEAIYDYTLQPKIEKPDNNSIIESDTTVNISVEGEVRNSGTTKSVSNIDWQISQFEYAPGSVVPQRGFENSVEACNSPAFTDSDSCRKISEGKENDGYTRSETKRYNVEATLEDRPVGTRFCFVISVNKYDTSNRGNVGIWRHSTPSCVVVAKKPKVQFSGADVRSNGTVYTSSTLTSRGLYGSWAEYAIMSSNGTVRSVSGAALSTEGIAGATSSEMERNRLTFANVNASGGSQYGNFGGVFTQPSIGARFPASAAADVTTSSVDVSALSSGTYARAGDLSINGGAVGQRVVIRATGTVTIASDVVYANGPYSSTAELPQLIIIASNIVISDTVGRVDAWLIAEQGYVSTCGLVSDGQWSNGLNATVCANRLTVNGPIVAKNLYLRRTFGESGDQPTSNPGTPAEKLNLRPDAYLYASSQSHTTGSIRTMHLKELPPRF